MGPDWPLPFPENFGRLAPFLPALSFEEALLGRFFEGEGLWLSDGGPREVLEVKAFATSRRAEVLSEGGRSEGESMALGPSKPVESSGKALRTSFSPDGILDLALARRESLLAKITFR